MRNRFVSRLRLGVVGAIIAASGCAQSAPTAPDGESAATLLATPTSAVVDGQALTLSTSLWRDFQPISPPDGKPMIVGLHVQSASGSAVPMTVAADAIWLIRGADVWSGVPREEDPRQPNAPTYEVVARDGPKWEPGIVIDVVIQLRDARGRASRLRAPNQLVRATF